MHKLGNGAIRIPDAECPFTAWVMDGGDSGDVDAEWLDFRKRGVGGSDVASIMGISKYRTPAEVWMEKTGRKESADLSGKEAVEWGNRLEDTIRTKFRESHPEFKVSVFNASLVSKERPWAHANLDGRIRDADGNWGILEIKTVGKNREDDWRDGVPDYYLTQVTHYMSVTGWRYAYVAALIGGQHYVEHRVDWDDGDVSAVVEVVDDFWTEYVEKDVMPELIGTASEAHALLDMYGVESTEYVSPENMSHFDALVHDYQEAKACEKQFADRAKRIANNIRAAAGSNKGVVSDVYRVTWVKSTASRFDQKRFCEENPELAEQYMTAYLRDGGLRITSLR